MSSLTAADRYSLEKLFGMASGYVLNFNDRTFGEFVADTVERDIHDAKYSVNGTSKANKLRTLWKIESDHLAGKLIQGLIDHRSSISHEEDPGDDELVKKCSRIASRLLVGGPNLDSLKRQAEAFNASHLKEQIRRMEAAVDTDPSLAIGTAKELLETCCKTILNERGKPISGTPDMPTLTKAVLKELNLVPESIQDAARGADVIKRLLSNLGTIGNGLAELRGLYGTGHGRHGNATGLTPRHAKLAVGAAATLAIFLFETHKENSL